MIKEHLGQQTQVLTVRFARSSVDFKDGNVSVPIDLVAGWRAATALANMPFHRPLGPKILKAPLTHPQLAGLCVVLGGKRGAVPRC